MTTTGPTNGSDAPDPNTVPGWSVQGSASQTGLGVGVPSAGYAQAGNTASAAALTTTGNGTPGVASPVSNNTSVANETSEILANPGYGNVSPSIISAGGLPATLVPVPASGSTARSLSRAGRSRR